MENDEKNVLKRDGNPVSFL